MNEEKNSTDVETTSISEGIARCQVTCPMCGHRHTQYRLNPHLYWFTEMEIDRKPTGFNCRRSLEGYYPSLYELWHCPDCHYTAHNRVFPDPMKNVYIERGLVARRLAEMKKSNPALMRVIPLLGADIAFETSTFTQAIRLSLLEIYFQQLILDLLHQNHAITARSYLRLAWLFRDWKAMDKDQAVANEALQQVLDKVAADWPECVRSEEEAMNAACDWFGRALDSSSTANQDALDSCGMMMQIARIRMQMKDYEAANKQLSMCHRTITRNLELLTRKMNEDLHAGKLADDERGRMVSDSRKYRSLLDESRDLMDTIAKKSQPGVSDKKKASDILAKNPKAAPAALRKLMEQAGVAPAVIKEMVPERKEGGLLGGLFR